MHRSKSPAFDIGRLTRFGVVKLTSIVALVVLTLGLGGNNRANAAGISINTPAGLNPGDTFRIAFVTDATTAATSNSIATYNTFVNADAIAEAGGGSVTYNGNPISFSAIGSTEATNAIDNIGQFGAPVYLVSGTEVALSDTALTGGLWSGHLFSPILTDLLGITPGSPLTWAGTDITGSAYAPYTLGSPRPTLGYTPSVSGAWILEQFSDPQYGASMYGISQPLTVPTPEPSSIVLGILAGCGAVGAFVRRRRAARRGR